MQLTSLRISRPWTYAGRLLTVIVGLFIFAVGDVCTYRANVGLGPWDVLHQGISFHTPLSFGTASIVVGAALIVLSLFLKVYPGVATLLNMSLIGIFINLQLQVNWLPDLSAQPLLLRLLVDIAGVFLIGLGSAIYISPHMGAGPRDGLMLRLNALTKMRIAIVRAVLECSVLLIGFLLGGSVGIGTLIFAFGIGPCIEIGLWLLNRLLAGLGLPPVTVQRPSVQKSASDLVPLRQE
ncbi:MAG: hypothetical protein JO031_04110 [Ktedonobacteraceae bacterium]|nr:hypothetical protein [Ktedonobacteraceae bacterium]